MYFLQSERKVVLCVLVCFTFSHFFVWNDKRKPDGLLSRIPFLDFIPETTGFTVVGCFNSELHGTQMSIWHHRATCRLANCRRREPLRNPIVIYINCETVFVLLDTASLHASRRNMLSSCFFSETFRRLIPKKLHVRGYPGLSANKFTCKDGEWCRLKGTVW